MQWSAVYGKTATCCVRATEEQVEAEPERFDCSTCELKSRTEGLFLANAEAWRVYQILCGRTVRMCEAYGMALEWVTAGWSSAERLHLLQRLDVILDVISPEDNGRPPTQD